MIKAVNFMVKTRAKTKTCSMLISSSMVYETIEQYDDKIEASNKWTLDSSAC